MKSFLNRLTGFTTFLILCGLGNYAINRFLIHNRPPLLSAHTLLMGDSHIMTAVNDAEYPGAINLAQEGEPYVVTYFKMKKVVAYNRIDTLIVGFSPHNISSFNDRKFSDTFWCDEIFDRTYPLISLSDLKSFEVNKTSYARAVIKNMLLYPNPNPTPYLGHFNRRLDKLDTSRQQPDQTIKRHFYLDGKELEASQRNIQYLDSIMAYTRKQGIRLVLLSTPLHEKYQKQIPHTIQTQFTDLSQRLKKRGLEVLDFSAEPYPDQFFADFDHLNYQGASLFTKRLKAEL